MWGLLSNLVKARVISFKLTKLQSEPNLIIIFLLKVLFTKQRYPTRYLSFNDNFLLFAMTIAVPVKFSKRSNLIEKALAALKVCFPLMRILLNGINFLYKLSDFTGLREMSLY